MTKTALIFGVTGQDGYYLTQLLLDKSYRVYGVARRTSTPNTGRIKDFLDDEYFSLLTGDVTDQQSVYRIINQVKPDEIYNLAAQSHVGVSFDCPSQTWDVTAKGALYILEAIREIDRGIKYYQASSSEMFGDKHTVIIEDQRFGFSLNNNGRFRNEQLRRLCKKVQNESTVFSPQSPYAVAKLAAHQLVKVYREAYGIFACAGILFNHESPLRGENFVTRKITKYIGDILKSGMVSPSYQLGSNKPTRIIINPATPKLKLGNLDAYRDWMHAEDAVRAMYLMMQKDKPDDYVVATGETYSVREFLTKAFKAANLEGLEKELVEIDQALFRPAEVDYLCGDSTKARKELCWSPTISFDDLVEEMVEAEMMEKINV